MLEDHIAEDWHKWRVFLKEAESCPVPISASILKGIRLRGFTAWDMSINLWTFVSKWLGPKQYLKRNRMGQAVENNGFELWRRLFRDYMGSDAHTKLAGQQQLLDFTKCNDPTYLSSHLDSWFNLVETYGGGLDDEIKKVMLLKIIPVDIRVDILRREEIKKLPLIDLIEYVRSQVSWLRSETLADHYSKSHDHTLPIASLKSDGDDDAVDKIKKLADEIKQMKQEVNICFNQHT